MVLFGHQAVGGQLFNDGRKKIGRGREIEKVIAMSGVVLVHFLQQVFQLLV